MELGDLREVDLLRFKIPAKDLGWFLIFFSQYLKYS